MAPQLDERTAAAASRAYELAENDRNLNVVIAGGGPVGLLLAASLLHRNQVAGTSHKVTLIEGRQNLATSESTSHRSWSIFLNDLGIAALKAVPGLYEDYAIHTGELLKSIVIHLGPKELKVAAGDESKDKGIQRLVDRNQLVASMAQYLQDRYGELDVNFSCKFDTKIMYVDHERKRILLRHKQQEGYLSYDLLVGCDGLRSVVREVFIKRHPDFCFDIRDTNERMKALHFDRPDSFEEGSLHMLGKCLGGLDAIAFPNKDGKYCIGIGIPLPSFDKIPQALLSDDPTVVADYMKENLSFQVNDWEDLGRQWVDQPWARTMENHASTYHSLEAGVVLMGDAAHATSPALGMGLNMGLRDAHVFCELMDAYKDDLNQVLPAFSKERVKEGHALTNLSHCVACLDPHIHAQSEFEFFMRSMGHGMLPWLIKPHPRMVVGSNPKAPLTEAYRLAREIGWLQKHEGVNEKLSREYFERKIGLLPPKEKRFFWEKDPIPEPDSISKQPEKVLGLDILLTD